MQPVIIARRPEPTTFEQRQARLLERLADQRWRIESGGTLLDGVLIATDRQSVAFITAAYVVAKEDPDYQIRWKVGTGSFITLDAATIIAIATIVRMHVQACFDREDVLTTQILAAADDAALAAIDITAGWPE